ncbi:metalloprotease [Halocatena salina]|uniref:Metalloprotease n=1 Tax=Halocatena salina TaxID=2934340 RepID=A0A8U0A3P7_9EURY|nr:metalloprotease [Halocatena salina]UPM42587.1 metalloprotease [Halocatena salina]
MYRQQRGGEIRFSGRELRDLGAAWLALGIAFTFFFRRDVAFGLLGATGQFPLDTAVVTLVISMGTVGVGFLLHELAHKIVAIRFGRVAEFRADYTMLALAIGLGLAGFLFAAPGAVYHAGREVTPRQNGLIAVAGPITNLLLAAVFFPLVVVAPDGVLLQAGQLGVSVNLILAAFNMLPFGPLDGRTVIGWSILVFALVFTVSAVLAVWAVLFVGFGL